MMAQWNTMVFHHTEHNTHMLYETEKFTNTWPRWPQQDFIMPTNIRLHRHPHCPNSCKIFCQIPSVLTCRNCTVCQTRSWCCMQAISLLITPATILSLIYLNLWMCLLRDSGLVIFLTKILIWSYSVAVLSQLYWAWIQNKELQTHTHTHKLLSNILFSIPSVPYSLADHSVLVPVLQMTCQTHFGNKLAASLSAATYSKSKSLKVPGKWDYSRLSSWAPIKGDTHFLSLPLHILQGPQ
jgi:hypothetical protein